MSTSTSVITHRTSPHSPVENEWDVLSELERDTSSPELPEGSPSLAASLPKSVYVRQDQACEEKGVVAERRKAVPSEGKEALEGRRVERELPVNERENFQEAHVVARRCRTGLLFISNLTFLAGITLYFTKEEKDLTKAAILLASLFRLLGEAARLPQRYQAP